VAGISTKGWAAGGLKPLLIKDQSGGTLREREDKFDWGGGKTREMHIQTKLSGIKNIIQTAKREGERSRFLIGGGKLWNG